MKSKLHPRDPRLQKPQDLPFRGLFKKPKTKKQVLARYEAMGGKEADPYRKGTV